MIEAKRSQTGGPLLGRNLDFPTLGYLNHYSLGDRFIIVDRKHAFASVGFPGLIGCLSGINETGLSVAVLEVYSTKEQGVEKCDVRGTPYALCFRRVLEECSTVDEAIKLLRSTKRTTFINLAISDQHTGGVLEITPKSVELRNPENGVCACTNHFSHDEAC